MYLFSISLSLRGILLIRPYLLGLPRMRQNTTNTGIPHMFSYILFIRAVPLRRYVFTWWYHRVTPVILAVQFLPARTPECNTTNMVYNVTLRVMSVYRIDLGISCSARRLYLNRASPFIPLRRCCFSGIVSGIVFSFFSFLLRISVRCCHYYHTTKTVLPILARAVKIPSAMVQKLNRYAFSYLHTVTLFYFLVYFRSFSLFLWSVRRWWHVFDARIVCDILWYLACGIIFTYWQLPDFAAQERRSV